MTEQIIPIFRVADAESAFRWYARLGFERDFEHRFEPELPLYLGIRRGDVRLHLSEHVGDAEPGSLAYVWVDDVDAVASEFGMMVHAEPWAREIQLRDPDGNRLRIGQPVPEGSGSG